MPDLSASDREWLSQEWRWIESSEADVRVKHRGAREAEYLTAWVTVAGALKAIDIIKEATWGDKKLLVAQIGEVIDVSFRSRPRTVRVHTARFGFDLEAGRDMICERVDQTRDPDSTTLYLTG